jgi:hypothetical protein
VRIVHPKTGEEAWWRLHDERGDPLFPGLMAELDAIKSRTLSGPMIRRDRKDRKAGVPVPWITAKGGLDCLRATVNEIVRAAKLRDDLSFASFRHGGFHEAADAALTDAQFGAIGQRGSSRPTPNAHVSGSLSSSMSPKGGVQSQRIQHVCHNERLTACQNDRNHPD